MATTKVGGGVVDLNSDNTAFKMPVGSSLFTGTPVAGMIRNNSSLANNNATTVFEYYDGTQWVGMNTDVLPFADFLVLSGGGSGGHLSGSYVNTASGGGGGAGGLRTSYGLTSGGNGAPESKILLSAGTSYTITIGGGGSSTTSSSNNGADSSISASGFTTITSIGGGAGGSRGGNLAQNGGSGGGEASYQNSQGLGTAGQGYNGSTYSALPGPSTGGGGAGGAGGVSSMPPSPGGDCMSIAITGTNVNYGAGGNSGHNTTGSPAYYQRNVICGIGGGVFGGSISQDGGDASPANRGSGGGGCSSNSSGGGWRGGNGSSGVVILRMPTNIYSGTTTGSPTVTTDGSDTILTYTGSGTYTH